jgi:hypothetical protein
VNDLWEPKLGDVLIGRYGKDVAGNMILTTEEGTVWILPEAAASAVTGRDPDEGDKVTVIYYGEDRFAVTD